VWEEHVSKVLNVRKEGVEMPVTNGVTMLSESKGRSGANILARFLGDDVLAVLNYAIVW
jgi:hypothetical protein